MTAETAATRRSAAGSTADPFIAAWADWHADRERRLLLPHGWLSVTALHWPGPEPEPLDGLPGRWSADGGGVVLHDPDGASAEGAALAPATPEGEPVRLAPADGGAPVTVSFAGTGAVAEVMVRSGVPAVRVRDPEAPARTAFAGLPAYPPSRAWVLGARFERFPLPREVGTGSVVEGLGHVRTAPGVLRFEFGGATRELLAFAGPGGTLTVQFRDATSGRTTPGSSRTLAVAAPADDGSAVLDFNRAAVMPCALTPHATCPLPPDGNTLPFPVEAGERDPGIV